MMTTCSNSLQPLKRGLVLLEPGISAALRILALQYNPDTLTRTLQVQVLAGKSEDSSEALRIKGRPVETVTLNVEIVATEGLAPPASPRVSPSSRGVRE
jgi:hypothetical protein